MPIVNLSGYVPDPESDRYWSFEDNFAGVMRAAGASAPSDLRGYTSPRHNQSFTNSCVAQSVVKALEIKRIMAGKGHVDLSVLHLYFLARQRMNPPQTDKDAGTHIWLAVNCIRKLGVCREATWGYDPSKIHLNPGWGPLREGSNHKIEAAFKIQGRGGDRVKAVIAALSDGNPVVYGTEVGSDWFGYRKGEVLSRVSGKVQGWHATVLLGWTGTAFLGENSWGGSWGDEGFYLISPDVIASSGANDFWLIKEGFED